MQSIVKQSDILDHFSSVSTNSHSQNKCHLLACLFKDTHCSLGISMLLIVPSAFYLVACYEVVSLTYCLFFSASGDVNLLFRCKKVENWFLYPFVPGIRKEAVTLQSPHATVGFRFLLIFHSESVFMDLFKYKTTPFTKQINWHIIQW